MSWNYRVIEFVTGDGDKWSAIHEVYYDDGTDKPRAYGADPAAVVCGEPSGGDHLAWTLDRMREALDKPTLTVDDFEPAADGRR